MQKVISYLALAVQVINAFAFMLNAYNPDVAFIVAAATGGIQAFLDKVQAKKK